MRPHGVLVLPLLVALAGCGAGSSSDAAGGEGGACPDTVEVTLLGDITGAAAFAGTSIQKGVEAAVEHVNSEGLLEGSTLEVSVVDTASDTREAATAMTDVADGDSLVSMYGPQSANALAIAPIAQDEGIPLVAIQSGTEGVVETGDYVFRATAPQSTYQQLLVDSLAADGVQTAAVVFQSEVPTLVELSQEYPDLLDEAGIDLVASEGFQGSNFDFAALASQVVDEDPDAIVLLGQGAANATVATQLLQSGFEGQVTGANGFSGGVLAPLGADADGFRWATDFHADAPGESVQTFVETFRDVVGEEPDNFAAEGWDAVLLTVAGIQAADSCDREGIRDGLLTATEAGLEGAAGETTFDERDARVPGVLVEWRDGAAQLLG